MLKSKKFLLASVFIISTLAMPIVALANDGPGGTGGGNIIGSPYAKPEDIVKYINSARTSLTLHFKEQAAEPSQTTAEPFREDMIRTLAEKPIRILKNSPCKDPDGNDADGSFDPKDPSHICISVFRLKNRLTSDPLSAEKEVLALAAHEYSHLLRYEYSHLLRPEDEDFAEAVQLDVMAKLSGRWSRYAYELDSWNPSISNYVNRNITNNFTKTVEFLEWGRRDASGAFKHLLAELQRHARKRKINDAFLSACASLKSASPSRQEVSSGIAMYFPEKVRSSAKTLTQEFNGKLDSTCNAPVSEAKIREVIQWLDGRFKDWIKDASTTQDEGNFPEKQVPNVDDDLVGGLARVHLGLASLSGGPSGDHRVAGQKERSSHVDAGYGSADDSVAKRTLANTAR